MMVSRFGNRYVMNMNYWDGGYVLLDVTEPDGRQRRADRRDRLRRCSTRSGWPAGHQIAPEGNAHQSELSPEHGSSCIGTDEDFNPFRVVRHRSTTAPTPARVRRRPGQRHAAARPRTTRRSPGPPTFVGLGCDPLAAPGTGHRAGRAGRLHVPGEARQHHRRRLRRGHRVQQRPGRLPVALVTMLAAGDIPFVFVNRDDRPAAPRPERRRDRLSAPRPRRPPARRRATTTIEAVFDGWGYVRLFRTDSRKADRHGHDHPDRHLRHPRGPGPRFADRLR